MIKHFLITGDIHGCLTRFTNIDTNSFPPEETAIIILGDAGFNYYFDARDIRLKNQAKKLGFTFFCVRGNHESRPEDISTMIKEYNRIICNDVYYEIEYPNIFYLIDGLEYWFDDINALILGGAYSVDKDYRRARGWAWWANEQLSPEEQCAILKKYQGKYFQFIFSHTCPLSWEPTEMFLSFIDQSKVDKSTETWLEEIEKTVDYDFWLFGHFHADKIINNNAAMLYEQILDLSMICPINKYTEIPEGFII